IMRYCKTKIHMRPIPSVNDINAIRAEKLMGRVDELIGGGELHTMTELVEKHMEETDCTALEMAAALLKISMGEFPETALDEGLDMTEGEGKAARVRLFVNVGKKDKVRPGDIVGAIAGESGMPGQLIGAIKMYDNYTFVEVPGEYADEVLQAMHNVKIKGRSVQVERANQGGGKSEGRKNSGKTGRGRGAGKNR
ncbi:MAG: DbpA RNA binding domain-containing protein, partial [Lachnospiraceae bacterium]